MMMNMPEYTHGLNLIRENPGIGVGIHLTVTCGRPVAEKVDSLMDASGCFHSQFNILHYGKSEDMEREFQSQIERFLDTGLHPTHIDSHHHIHMHERVLPIALKLADQYDLAVRLGRTGLPRDFKYSNLRTTDFFTDAFYGQNLTQKDFLEILHKAQDYNTVEVMCHPAFIDNGLLAQSRYSHQRRNELDILTDEKMIEKIKGDHIQFIHYGDL